jgi:uncharacterized protein
MYSRKQIAYAKACLFKGKAFIIFGARQVGKTTFALSLVDKLLDKTKIVNGDEADVRDQFLKPNVGKLKRIIGKHKILLIDEAQRIMDIGLVIKIIVDQIKDVQVIATGSSAFELSNKINEPLTGRKYEMYLYPMTVDELVAHHGWIDEKRSLEQRLIYGSYPEIVANDADAEEHIKLIANSYLYKDLFILDQMTKPALLEKIVKALAMQIGSEVNYNELSQLVTADNKTIERYVDMLEKAFIIFKLDALSGNVRNEIKKKKKIYFYDNGIVNAVKGNFNAISNRDDIGALWENYIISERMKYLNINNSDTKRYFWRSTQQQEIDYIEVKNKVLTAYEIKCNPTAKAKFPITFLKAHQPKDTVVITTDNYDDFLLD